MSTIGIVLCVAYWTGLTATFSLASKSDPIEAFGAFFLAMLWPIAALVTFFHGLANGGGLVTSPEADEFTGERIAELRRVTNTRGHLWAALDAIERRDACLSRANAIIGQQADEAKTMSDRIVQLEGTLMAIVMASRIAPLNYESKNAQQLIKIFDAALWRATVLLVPDACTGCYAPDCSRLWPEQKKCCPDCSHGSAVPGGPKIQ